MDNSDAQPSELDTIYLTSWANEIIEARDTDTSAALPKFAGESAADETTDTADHYPQGCSFVLIPNRKTKATLTASIWQAAFFAIRFSEAKAIALRRLCRRDFIACFVSRRISPTLL